MYRIKISTDRKYIADGKVEHVVVRSLFSLTIPFSVYKRYCNLFLFYFYEFNVSSKENDSTVT